VQELGAGHRLPGDWCFPSFDAARREDRLVELGLVTAAG